MDAFMKKIERLADMAARRPSPLPLDPGGVMDRIRGLEIEDDVLRLPMGFFAGGAVAAAVAAIAVSVVAAMAWSDLNSPLTAMRSMLDVMEFPL